ncbi:protein FAR1-RELATED SEQUENCE 12-like [Coffea arabica]|uniref:Protein FAR1-RELATED SEQUENCE n=1 Tax=Coffea arabica TaxID=13443 RepID=A0ABM4V352_COFAR
MLMDYTYFGDVVTFDTTYKTNKKYRPLDVFVGFNQFRQLVIFGATLLYDETIESFKWMFGTFVEAVCGKHPKIIFTDQDAAMAAAISAVMPSTYHGLCTFHIRVNFMKHPGNYYKDGSNLPYRFVECMYEIKDENEFIMAWDAMLKEHKLETNEWLRGIYVYRKKWAKCFMKGVWTAASIYSPCMFVAFQNEYDESTTMEGILCSHALKVYDMVGTKFIPNQYVTKRWIKKARSGGNVDCKGREISSDLSLSISHRYRLLAPEMVRLTTRAAMSEAAIKLVSSVMSELSKRVEMLFCGEIDKITHKSTSMDLCKEIQVQNAPDHFVTPTGLKKRSGRKTKKVLRSWVDRFHRQKKNSRLSKASTPKMSFSESNFGSSPIIHSDMQSCTMPGETGITPQILGTHNIRIQDRNNLPLLIPNDPVSKTKYSSEFLMHIANGALLQLLMGKLRLHPSNELLQFYYP